jgi:hypothetical protein
MMSEGRQTKPLITFENDAKGMLSPVFIEVDGGVIAKGRLPLFTMWKKNFLKVRLGEWHYLAHVGTYHLGVRGGAEGFQRLGAALREFEPHFTRDERCSRNYAFAMAYQLIEDRLDFLPSDYEVRCERSDEIEGINVADQEGNTWSVAFDGGSVVICKNRNTLKRFAANQTQAITMSFCAVLQEVCDSRRWRSSLKNGPVFRMGV